MSRGKLAVGVSLVAGVIVFSSVAYACTVMKGKISVVGDASTVESSAIGLGSGSMLWTSTPTTGGEACSGTTTTTVCVAGQSGTITVKVRPEPGNSTNRLDDAGRYDVNIGATNAWSAEQGSSAAIGDCMSPGWQEDASVEENILNVRREYATFDETMTPSPWIQVTDFGLKRESYNQMWWLGHMAIVNGAGSGTYTLPQVAPNSGTDSIGAPYLSTVCVSGDPDHYPSYYPAGWRPAIAEVPIALV